MPFEINFKNLFQDFNPSKFLVYGCLMVFSLLFALRLDGFIMWSYWIVFLPIWIWKVLVLTGAVVGSYVWWKHPNYRVEGDSYIQYKAMVICTGQHLLLLMFELLACAKLQSATQQILWVVVFIPFLFMAIISMGTCIWAVKHERTFELEVFCSANILQFIFLALRLDKFITWSWVIVFIPLWIVMCVALIGVLYAIILALILLKSPDLIPEQRRGNVFSAVGYTCLVVPLLIFQILLVNKEDHMHDLLYTEVVSPLLLSLFTLMLLSFGSKGGNHWWFGLRRDFCPWMLSICPVLQEYGNISYKLPQQERPSTDAPDGSSSSQTGGEGEEPAEQTIDSQQRAGGCHVQTTYSKRGYISSGSEDSPLRVMPVVSIEMPD
ncbi:hypothetical protein CAPTEDRAFT_221172 [Capitella teleta]|uniref:Transmembrane protein 185B n=1 Tax=Capitella teleta TaxID=283909 RepID=R7V2S3_CAPTE|nr:hypothetical protein CAPTEDRAFT_221172 [Capitella teleta]|eukprot:ELU12772.1 hypothetical protein CAPTEDRAFT_221172 [Capitella teleta]